MSVEGGKGILSRPECLQRLASGRHGRIAVSLRSLPTIITVSYTLDGDELIVSSMVAPAVLAAVYNNVVTFQADGPHDGSGAGWSVLVTGFARPNLPYLPDKDGLTTAPVELEARITTKLMEGANLTDSHRGPLPGW
jgi:hypothetical protein